MSRVDDTTAGGEGARPAEPEPSAAPRKRDLLRPNIALTLAALIVLGSGLAILQVDASANESNAARQTTRTAVQAMRANVVADTVTGLVPVLQSERDFLAFRRPLDPHAPSLSSAAGAPSPPGATRGELRVAQQAVPDLGAATLTPRLQTAGQRLTLKQRALATTRITWNDRSTQYTTVIAVLAVAIFLVGFALVVEGPIRRSSYLLGIGIGIFAAVWTVWIYHLPIPSTPAGAIDAAARGAVLTDEGDYRAAVAKYDAALKADDGYATAYSGRARASLLGANPDYPVTRAVTAPTGAAVEGAIRDAQRARELNPRDILSAAIVALMSFYHGDVDRALEAIDAAIAINPKVPDLWLLKSAIQVERGAPAAATAALKQALALVSGQTPSERTRLLASSYLSYLAQVAHDAPARAATAQRFADQIVATETAFTLGHALPPRLPAHGTVSVQRLRYARGRLRLLLRWRNLPAGTALSGLGYERPLEHGAWTQPSALALFATVSGSGRRSIDVPLQQRVCKPTGVRVDVYLNGVRTLTKTGPGVRATC
jgi:tetratricopeptide (TPR) repeat protein